MSVTLLLNVISCLAEPSNLATTPSSTLWPPRYRQDVDDSGSRTKDIRKQEHAADGIRTECQR